MWPSVSGCVFGLACPHCISKDEVVACECLFKKQKYLKPTCPSPYHNNFYQCQLLSSQLLLPHPQRRWPPTKWPRRWQRRRHQ